MKNIKPPRIAKIISVEPYKIVCLFTNGQTRQIDFTHLLDTWKASETTAKLLGFEAFKQVSVSESQTLQWTNVKVYLPFLPSELQYQPYDLDPDVLYQQSTLLKESNQRSMGKLLKKARKQAGLTQEELAKRSGTHRYYISRIENGKSDIRLDTLERIVEVGLGKKIIIE